MKELTDDDIIDDVVAVKINRTYKPGMSAQALYEATRGVWILDCTRASRAKYVFSVCNGIIIEVFTPKKWQKAGETPYLVREELKDNFPEKYRNRFEFIGEPAPQPVRERYINNSIASIFGGQNPIGYFPRRAK